MKMPILQRLLLLWVLLTCPVASLVWAGENTAVPATTPTSDFILNDTDGTAYHIKTGLTWKRCAEGQIWDGTTCAGTAGGYAWPEALQLGPASGVAGFSDWRLPNLKELSSIVEQRNWSPAINTEVFPSAPLAYFWSASPYAPYSGGAWVVVFSDGDVGASGKGSSDAVRLVRGGQYSLLSVSKTGGGGGTVTSTQPGIDCGKYCKGSFANEMFTASQVVLSAIPDAHSTFGGWTGCPDESGNQCIVDSLNNLAITADFELRGAGAPIPSLSIWGLLLFTAVMGLLGYRRVRPRV